MSEFDWFVKCPVPRDQRPFYEYLKLKQSVILGWVVLNETRYTKRFFIGFLVIFTLLFPILNSIISLFSYPLQAFLLNLLFSLISLGLLYTYFFVAWFYTGQRLLEAKVLYEESGWYDGRIWIKPPAILKHERLLYHYQLVPLINRIKNTLKLIFLCILVVALFSFFLFY